MRMSEMNTRKEEEFVQTISTPRRKGRKEGKEEKRKNVLLWKHLEQLSSRPRDNPQPEHLMQCTRET
jgi:hypothetical protein